jgi:hypothetical protein
MVDIKNRAKILGPEVSFFSFTQVLVEKKRCSETLPNPAISGGFGKV